MNTKGNQRFVQTRQKIKGVFLELLREKKIGEITVSEICRRADIHRTTFYGHFDDVYDLMQNMVEEMYVQLMDFFIVDDKVWLPEGFLQLFQFIREHRDFFRSYLEIYIQQRLSFQVIPTKMEEQLVHLLKEMDFSSKEELYYHQTFFCEGLKAVLKLWISRDCAEEPEEMCRIIEKEYSPNRGFFA